MLRGSFEVGAYNLFIFRGPSSLCWLMLTLRYSVIRPQAPTYATAVWQQPHCQNHRAHRGSTGVQVLLCGEMDYVSF